MISVAASVDPAAGGNPNLLRDGAISGNAAYNYNTGGEAGFSARLHQLIDELRRAAGVRYRPRGGKPSAGLIDFASSSASWIENRRKVADDSGPVPGHAARAQHFGALQRQRRQHGRRDGADAAGRAHLFGVGQADLGRR